MEAAEIAHPAAGEGAKTAIESAPAWIRTSMKITIKCDCEDLRLKIGNYFVKGGSVNQPPDRSIEYTNEIEIRHTSNIVRKGFKGLLVCQVESTKSEFPDATFIVVGWKAPLTGSAQIYTLLVETRRDNPAWDEKSMRGLYESLHGQFSPYTDEIKEAWSLENNTYIELTTVLCGNRDYNLDITIDNARKSNESCLPIWFGSKK
jgi:hypothetical protein